MTGQTRTIVSGHERMTLHHDGTITRENGFRGSQAWRITGAITYNNFGRVTRRYTLNEILADPKVIPWRFKNGKQRTFLQDIDHGTPREWRNPTHFVL